MGAVIALNGIIDKRNMSFKFIIVICRGRFNRWWRRRVIFVGNEPPLICLFLFGSILGSQPGLHLGQALLGLHGGLQFRRHSCLGKDDFEGCFSHYRSFSIHPTNMIADVNE